MFWHFALRKVVPVSVMSWQYVLCGQLFCVFLIKIIISFPHFYSAGKLWIDILEPGVFWGLFFSIWIAVVAMADICHKDYQTKKSILLAHLIKILYGKVAQTWLFLYQTHDSARHVCSTHYDIIYCIYNGHPMNILKVVEIYFSSEKFRQCS